jgi:hypothetical protein
MQRCHALYLTLRSELDEMCSGANSGCLPSLAALAAAMDDQRARREVRAHLRCIQTEARAAVAVVSALID